MISPASPIVTRFAPSPNGWLHLGHAYSAILNHEVARLLGGRFLLRIEDIDPERSRPEFETAIYRDLDWLGLSWEQPVRRQSEHLATYRGALSRLQERGLAYPAFMSRSEIAAAVAVAGPSWPTDPDGTPHYPSRDRDMRPGEVADRLAAGAQFTVRLNTARSTEFAGRLTWRELAATGWNEQSATPDKWGDVILGRRDVPASYHLAVVIDDAGQGVTHIIRGGDLAAATSVHRLLQGLLSLPTPHYCHHELVVDDRGVKLSKSASAQGLHQLRAQGITAAALRARLAVDREAARVAEAITRSSGGQKAPMQKGSS